MHTFGGNRLPNCVSSRRPPQGRSIKSGSKMIGCMRLRFAINFVIRKELSGSRAQRKCLSQSVRNHHVPNPRISHDKPFNTRRTGVMSRLRLHWRRFVINGATDRSIAASFATSLPFYRGVVKYQLMPVDCVSEGPDSFDSDVAEDRNWTI